MDWSSYHYVMFDPETARLWLIEGIDSEDKPQIKLALKEAKLIKKELTAERRELTQAMANTRADNTHKQAQRMHVGRGGGGVGKFMRGFQAASKAADRSQASKSVQAVEQQRADIDAVISAVGKMELMLERLLL